MINSLLIKAQLNQLTHALQNHTETARLDAELLMMFVLQQPRTYLYAHSEAVLSEKIQLKLKALLSKRILGEPMAYLLGEREFWSLPLYVTPDTLIPRPETEQLIEKALTLLKKQKKCTVLELGTGSGAISIALATERPHWQFFAADISKKALSIAEKNIHRHALSNIQVICSDWFKNIEKKQFDLIISNPPYLAENDPHQHRGDLRFEPKTALLSGHNGLEDIEQIIKKSISYLKPGGLLLLEHGYEQAKPIQKMFHLMHYEKLKTWKDLNQLDRISSAWKRLES